MDVKSLTAERDRLVAEFMDEDALTARARKDAPDKSPRQVVAGYRAGLTRRINTIQGDLLIAGVSPQDAITFTGVTYSTKTAPVSDADLVENYNRTKTAFDATPDTFGAVKSNLDRRLARMREMIEDRATVTLDAKGVATVTK